MVCHDAALSWSLSAPAVGSDIDVNSNSAAEITFTGIREAMLKPETPGTVSSVSEADVQEVKPAHPGEVMNRTPGVHVNVTGGERHMTPMLTV